MVVQVVKYDTLAEESHAGVHQDFIGFMRCFNSQLLISAQENGSETSAVPISRIHRYNV
jgi:hypothetical protein